MTRERSYNLGRVCPCGAPVSNRAKNGICRLCFMAKLLADPERGKKIGATNKRRLTDPVALSVHREAARRAGMTKRASPELTANAARVMREKVQPLSMTPEALARRDYAFCGKRRSEVVLAWCPPEYRDEYRHLLNQKKIKKADAKAIILADIEAKKPKAEALSPFERQERALREGAALQDNVKADRFSHYTAERAAKIA